MKFINVSDTKNLHSKERQIEVTVKHGVKVWTRRGQNDPVASDRRHPDPQVNVAKLKKKKIV